MGSLGPPARAMAVRSAFALFCFALLCGLAASSIQSETETDLTKEGEAAGDEVLVEQAVESRVARGAKKTIRMLRKKCEENRDGNACKRLKEKRRANARKNKNKKATRKVKKSKKTGGGKKKKGRKAKKNGGEKGKKNKGKKRKNKKKNKKKSKNRANKQAQKLKLARRERKKTESTKSNATVALTCLKTALQLLKFQKDNVNNFLARHVRQQRQNALSTKKKGKKGEYAEPAARLIQSGGGNKSNLTCEGPPQVRGQSSC